MKALAWDGFLRTRARMINHFTMRTVYRRRHLALVRERRWTKLQLGAGSNALDGWLNTDLRVAPDVPYVDARELPFANSQFEYVFSEHMIEHISYSDGQIMLAEIFRVLAPGGKLRIATPDLRFFIGLLSGNLDSKQQDYVDWASVAISPQLPHGPVSVVNTLFRNFGHQHIYDEQTLTAALQAQGFRDVVRCQAGESEEPSLRGLESHGKLVGEERNRLESLIVEARKPAAV